MPFALTPTDHEIYYESRGAGPSIAFVSGFMGITDIWRDQVDALSDRFHCISFDTRGAGRSDKPDPNGAYGVDQHAEDLAAVLDAANVSKALVVGHSMGGNIACRFFRANPDRVAGIAFVGSYVSGTQIQRVGNTLERITSAVTKKSDRIRFYQSVGLPIDIAIESTKWPLYALLGNARSFMEFDGSDELRDISVPCLVIHGSEDIVSPYDPCALGLISQLPDVRSKKFDGVNHCPMVERPDATNEILEDFIQHQVHW